MEADSRLELDEPGVNAFDVPVGPTARKMDATMARYNDLSAFATAAAFDAIDFEKAMNTLEQHNLADTILQLRSIGDGTDQDREDDSGSRHAADRDSAGQHAGSSDGRRETADVPAGDGPAAETPACDEEKLDLDRIRRSKRESEAAILAKIVEFTEAKRGAPPKARKRSR